MSKRIIFTNECFNRQITLRPAEKIQIKTERSELHIENGIRGADIRVFHRWIRNEEQYSLQVYYLDGNIIIKDNVRDTIPRSTNAVLDLKPECKICLTEIVEVMFNPCGHAVCCEDCKKRLRDTRCINCRQQIDATTKIRF